MSLRSAARYENLLLLLLFLAFGTVFFDRLALSYLFPFMDGELGLANRHLGRPAGAVIGPPVIVAVAGTFGWRAAFYLTCVPGIVIALLIWKFVHDKLPEHVARHRASLAEPDQEDGAAGLQVVMFMSAGGAILAGVFSVFLVEAAPRVIRGQPAVPEQVAGVQS